jgi:hypothetical protein
MIKTHMKKKEHSVYLSIPITVRDSGDMIENSNNKMQ